ncbi:MAG: hypothetical protein WCV93_02695 [Candidatus Shapirobacteria bacterium]|jgi:ABC-type uncharacterized transport system substrate-binding protein
MKWFKVLLIIFIVASFFFFRLSLHYQNISPNSNNLSQYLKFKSALESNGFIIHTIDISSLNQAKVLISNTKETPSFTVYFNLDHPIEQQLMLLQKVTKIATIKLKYPYLIDFGGEKPYATLKNN